MRRSPFTVWCGCLLLLTSLLVGRAEAQATRGIISGTVTDKSGAVLPGVTVTITNQDTGIARTTVSSTDGIYRVAALENGMYKVRAELSGFQVVETKDVEVKTAQEVVLDLGLAVASLSEVLQVSADASVATLNRTNATIGSTATARQAVELPLSAGRDVNQLALLTPTAYMAPGSTGISIGGNRARNNNFTIDGSDNNDISVTLSTTPIVPEAVAEFHLEVNPYNVEFGRSSGGQINVITRSGTNVLHGDLWEYYRTAGLNALDNIEKGSGLKNPAFFVRNQFGAGVGGPIVRSKVFFYGLMQEDRNRNHNLSTTNVRIPTPAGYALLGSVPLGANQTPASRQAVLDRIGFLQDVYAQKPVFRSIQTTTVNGVGIETGLTNLVVPQPNTTHNLFGRTDVQVATGDNLTGRYVMNKPRTENNNSNTGFNSRFASATDTFDQNLSGSYTRVFSPTLLNEARVSYIHRNLQFPENDPSSPTATIGGNFFTIGGLANFPQGRIQDSFQFSDTLTKQFGKHGVKLGADIRYIVLDNIAAFDSKGTFNFDNFQAYMNNLASFYQQALQTASFHAKQWQSFLFVQDDFKVTPNLTVNMGLRYELSTVPFGFFGATDQQSLAALVPGPVKKDTNNWAPRVGVAWSPSPAGGFMKGLFGNGDGVVRAGFGVTYDILFYNLLTVDASNYPRVVVPRIDNAQNLYPNVQPLTGSAVFNPLAGYVNTPEDAQNPRTSFWNLSIQRQVGSSYTFEVGYLGNIGRNGINQLQANPATLTAAQAATVVATLDTTSIPTVQARRDFPQFGARTLIATSAKSEYHAGYVSVNKRMSHGLQIGGGYTFSKYMSDNDESLGVGAITNGSPQIPQDYKDIGAEWSLSAFDRRHRGYVNWIYEMPGYQTKWLDLAAGGWQLSGVFQAQSGQPFSIVTGVDSNGNGGGGDRPNVLAGGTLTPDPATGNLRTFTTSNLFFVPRGSNGLPLAFSLGNGNLGRNTLRAPAFYNWDLSVSKRFKLYASHTFLIRADFLNAFNQDNYGIPVNSLNSVAFGTNTQNWGNRSVTLSAKYTF
jgi:outer membrane receptor protein involved in Fe transport